MFEFLLPPAFPNDEEKTRIAGLLNVILLVIFVSAIALPLALIAVEPEIWAINAATAIATTGLMLALKIALQRGYVQLVGWLLSSILFGIITFTALAFSDQNAYNIAGYFLVIAVASLIVGDRAAITFGLLGILSSLLMMLAQGSDNLPGEATVLEALTFSAALGMTSLLLRSAARSITAGFERVHRHQQALEESNYELQDLHTTLETRTRDLVRRSAYMDASTQVVRAAASVLDTERLIKQVVELICTHFELYYVGLFLVDESGQWAALRAGTGDAGAAMLARDHRIKIGEGMIGWSVAYAQARVASEASADDVRLVIAELPNTRSEAALPLRSRGRILGALTVQSEQPGAFDEVAMSTLQVMADHVAVALDNAHLYAESQAALDVTRRAYGDLSQQAWTELLSTRTDWGYRYARQTVAPAGGGWRPEMQRAGQTGQTVLQNPGSAPGEDDAEQPALAIPIMVREQVIGVLGFCKGEGDEVWTNEEVAMLETLAAQLGPALESAQLHLETRRRAARERLTGQIASRLRETLDIETVLRTAVREMREVLGLEEAEVRLGLGMAAGEARTQAAPAQVPLSGDRVPLSGDQEREA